MIYSSHNCDIFVIGKFGNVVGHDENKSKISTPGL